MDSNMGTSQQEQQQHRVEHLPRWSWNLYPANRIDAARMVVPLGCVYAPIGSPCTELNYEPLRCVCGGVLNPYCIIDYRSRTWGCPFCGTKNNSPPKYAQITEHNFPSELARWNDTVEYVSTVKRDPPTFVFVLDTCIDTEGELNGLKEFALDALSKLPAEVRICLITYGTTVQIHELSGVTDYPRSLVLRGSQEVTVEALKKIMREPQQFVGVLSNVKSVVALILEEMQQDVWPVPKSHRPLRCTGAALSAAASILEIVSPNTGSCILGFTSGICTEGPGIVVETTREKFIRGHADIRDGAAAASFWESSCAFYESLMHRIVKQGHSLSCFTASLDQTGIAEMKLCIQASGGVVLNDESWCKEPFRQSLHRFFERREDGTLKMGLNVTMDVITSATWKVMGVIGQCVGTGKKSSSVADYEVGMGGTCQWTACMMDSTTNFAVYFDTTSAPPSEAARQAVRYAQFITKYEIGNEVRTRVCTVTHQVQRSTSMPELAASFDQETAAVLLAREALHKADTIPLFDVLRWLDRTVVRLVSRFGDYLKDHPSTLKLPPQFVFFPAFMYHLRRSGYLQVFNCSPDETAILRLMLLKSSVQDSIIQIQPTLYTYRMDAPPQPVLLDSAAIQPDNVLLLDTFFEVLIHLGSTIAAWRKAGYAEQEEYAYFREFLEVPVADAEVLIAGRYPTPRFIYVCQDDPDARILYNRINPSRSYGGENEQRYGTNEGELVYTDDASLGMFMEHLKKLAVSQ
ncbi:protein transport protein Sec23-like protein [Trypanosoma rangeli]|uniref:Protein transport protein SEC23 n=2 Tax=Trypanosoma rangeli TaxID=5698 RepID=A0A3R7L1N0_TRYRA|nr:protein transport protein Sec23-like protein [Trypanosoma rangeli]RNF05792.1 protein transport protein Sec23-like protein [Trypanosoma rangeli]|eukprot:RNF05792.1 protein transport protein Sec23-like protein [Trypanosoma rangeli]